MLSKLFLSMSLLGAEWVLYILIILSITSVALMFERFFFYRAALKDIQAFRAAVQSAVQAKDFPKAHQAALARQKAQKGGAPDLETEISAVLLSPDLQGASHESINELSQSAILKTRSSWDKNLTVLATIGANAPFIGLFGTVLGIIQAFHDLSQKADGGAGAQSVTAGISDALVATAVGILVAIPAVVAYNFFQRKVKSALNDAEALRSFLIGHMTKRK